MLLSNFNYFALFFPVTQRKLLCASSWCLWQQFSSLWLPLIESIPEWLLSASDSLQLESAILLRNFQGASWYQMSCSKAPRECCVSGFSCALHQEWGSKFCRYQSNPRDQKTQARPRHRSNESSSALASPGPRFRATLSLELILCSGMSRSRERHPFSRRHP